MNANNKPATPLPWWFAATAKTLLGTDIYAVGHRDAELLRVKGRPDAAYIAHAANAYPALVVALQSALSASKGDWQKGQSWDRAAHALLQSLGESE